MKRALLFLLALSSAVTLVSCECDTLGGWYGGGDLGACYGLGALTSEGGTAAMDWFTAVKHCKTVYPGKETFLASVKSQAAQDLIRSTLLGVGPLCVWTSGNDLGSEGQYEWGFDSGDPVEFIVWHEGEPTNVVYDCGAPFHEDEDCLDMWADYQYEMDTIPCTYDQCQPLCQYSPTK